MDDCPIAAGHDGHLAPVPEGAVPVRVVQLEGGLAGAAAEDLLGVQNSAPELKKCDDKSGTKIYNDRLLP